MWMKFRHKVTFIIVKPMLRIFLFLKFRFRAKKYSLPKGPCIMLYNHQTNFDPLMMALSFKGPIYYMANDDLFNIRVISTILRYLVAPIPKSKSIRDIQAIKTCIKIVKKGGRIAIAPEGNRSYSGHLENIDKAIVKLIRMLNVPVVLYNIKGGFGSNPRFSKGLRKGKMFGEVNRVLSIEEVNNLTDTDLYNNIIEALDVDDISLNQKFKGKALAESLESVFYVCPVCKQISTISSKGDYLHCKSCGLDVQYTEELKFRTDNDRFKFETISQYYLFQKHFMHELDVKDIQFTDDKVTLRHIIKNKKREDVMTGQVSLDQNGLIISNNQKTISFEYKYIISLAVVYHNTLIINLSNDTYQIVADKNFNALKYVHLFFQLKNIKQGDKYGFLGI